jgi:hypothetical protein
MTIPSGAGNTGGRYCDNPDQKPHKLRTALEQSATAFDIVRNTFDAGWRAWTSSLRQTKLHAIPRSLSAASSLLQSNASACNPITCPSTQGQGRIGRRGGSDPSLQPAAPDFATLIAPAQTEASTKLVHTWTGVDTSGVPTRTQPKTQSGTNFRPSLASFRICDQCRIDPELIQNRSGLDSSWHHSE